MMKNSRIRTKEQVDKQQATLAKQKENRNAQTMHIGDYTVRRLDEYNWTIVDDKGHECGFYAHRIDALRALPIKLLDYSLRNQLADLNQLLREYNDKLNQLVVNDPSLPVTANYRST
jgi:hypothetical protein